MNGQVGPDLKSSLAASLVDNLRRAGWWEMVTGTGAGEYRGVGGGLAGREEESVRNIDWDQQ